MALKEFSGDLIQEPKLKEFSGELDAPDSQGSAYTNAYKKLWGKLVPNGNDLRDVAAATLKIGPTALKGVGDLAQLVTGGNYGTGISNAMTEGMQAIDDVVGSPELRTQKQNVNTVLNDPTKGIGDLASAVIDNPRAAVDAGVSTIGSLFLPAGAAKAVTLIPKAANSGKAATAAAIGTGGAMNAADTFTSIDSPDLGDKYSGAAISGLTSLGVGALTGGGAEGLIAKKIANDPSIRQAASNVFARLFGQPLKTMGKEGLQEAGEASGNYLGEVVGDGKEFNANQLGKRAAYEGALGAILGGGVGAATNTGGQPPGITIIGNPAPQQANPQAAANVANLIADTATMDSKLKPAPADIELTDTAQPTQDQPVDLNVAPTPDPTPATDDKIIQNRNRATPSSIAQMTAISAAPDYNRLSFSRDFANGAPVVAGGVIPAEQLGASDVAVASDGRRIPVQYAVVDASELLPSNQADGTENAAFYDNTIDAVRAIAGNGRIAGLQAAYGKNTADAYRTELEADTLHGIDPQVIAGMANPVLVRVMPQESVTADIGDVSNTVGNLELSPVEQANNDVQRVNLEALSFADDGSVTPQAVRQFVQAMPQAEQGSLLDTNGQPTKQAVDRLNAAIFAKAYNNDKLIRLYAQAQDAEARVVLSALAQVAPKMARLEGAGQLDIRQAVTDAAEIAVNARRNGLSITRAAQQVDITADPNVVEVLTLFAANVRSSKAVAEALGRAADFAYSEAIKPAEDMFGEVPKASRQEVFNQLGNTDEPASTQDLPDAQGAGGVSQDPARAAVFSRGQGDANGAGEGGSVNDTTARQDAADYGLDSYTNRDIVERLDRIEKAQKEAADRAKAEEAKRQADLERETFGLTGSESPTDRLEAQGQGRLFQDAQGYNRPWYTSALSSMIAGAKQATMPAGQWAAWINGNAAKNGVKSDEIEWSGINEYLALEGNNKLSREQVAAYLDDNGVQISEVLKGDATQAEIDRLQAVEDKAYAMLMQSVAGTTMSQTDEMNLPWWAFEEYRGDEDATRKIDRIGLSQEARAAVKAYGEARSAVVEAKDNKGNTRTKYGSYTLPGGSNYGELLIRFPDVAAAKQRALYEQVLALETPYLRAGQDLPPDVVAQRDALRKQIASLSGKFREQYRSNHWEESNILAHVRFNDRVDADGNRVLFIEEIQSDWAQAGRKRGFNAKPPVAETAAKEAYDAYASTLKDRYVDWYDKEFAVEISSQERRRELAASQADNMSARQLARGIDDLDTFNQLAFAVVEETGRNTRAEKKAETGIPSAPFVKDTKAWVGLAIKRMIAYGAQNGYDKIAFVNGEQSATRYDLSKQIDRIDYNQNEDGSYNLSAIKDGSEVFAEEEIDLSRIEDVVGKDIAKKIEAGEGTSEAPADQWIPEGEDAPEYKTLSGIDLKVGGEGMKSFYDRIVPQVANDVLKKLGGGKVEPVPFSFGDKPYAVTDIDGVTREFMRREEAEFFADENPGSTLNTPEQQLGFTITPAMREKVAAGLPLFQKSEAYNSQYGRQIDFFLDYGSDAGQDSAAGDAAKRQAVSAVDDLRSSGSVLGKALSSDYATGQRTTLVGREAKTAEDLATLAQVYRDPRFETFRVIFVNDAGRVLSQVGLTSRLPTSTEAIMGDDIDAYLSELSNVASKRGATGYWMLHNHPSGQATPSNADVRITQLFGERMPGLTNKGHVVIDTNEYATISDKPIYREVGNEQDPNKSFYRVTKKDFGAVQPMTAGEFSLQRINGAEDAMRMAKKLDVDHGSVTIIGLDAQMRVQRISAVPSSVFSDSHEANRLVLLKESLSNKTFRIILVGRDRTVLENAGRSATDAIHIANDGTVKSLTASGQAGWKELYPSQRRTRVSPDTSPEFDYLRNVPTSQQLAAVREDEADFGPVLTQYRGDANGAIKKLMELQTGDAVGALSHPEIGDIDLIYGKAGDPKYDYRDGFGLGKIAGKHPEVLADLQNIVAGMRITLRSENRINLESATHKGAVRLEWNGQRKTWLLTAFEKVADGANTRTDTIGLNGEGDTARSAAAASDIVANNADKANLRQMPPEYDNPQADMNVPPSGMRFDPIRIGDWVKTERGANGRRQYVAGRKLWDRAAGYANEYLGKLKLADTKPGAFKEMLRQFNVDKTKASQQAKRIAETGMDLTPEQRAMLSDLIEKQSALGDVPPQEIVDLAATMTAALDVQARELVDLGMLSEDRLVKNYLPRLYKNGLAGMLTNPTLMRSWFAKARMRIRGDRLKSRGMFTELPVAQVEQAKKLGWKVSGMMDGAPLPDDLLKGLETDNIPGKYADAKIVMWRDYTQDEREQMGEIRDGVLRYALGYVDTQKDIAIGRLFKAIASNSDLAKDHNPGGWVKVPDQEIKGAPGTKAYGVLSGMWVEPQVADSLKRNTQPKGVLMAAYDKALSFWKEGKTVWNPVAHGNNVVSNLFTIHFAGINPTNPKAWRETLREYRTKGKYYNEALDNGLFGNEWANQEIQDLLMPDFADMASLEDVAASRVSKVIDLAKKAGKPVSWYRKKMQKAYEFEDQFFKLMLYIDRRKAGMDPQEAITDAERYVFNYADMPEGVELIKRTASPFFAYTYKAIPMVLHTAMTRPDRMLAPIALLGGANWLAYMILGADEEEERKAMPEYMKGRTFIGTQKAIRLPFNIDDRPAFLDMSRRVPLGDLFDINNQTNGLPIPAPFMPSHPVLSMLQAVVYNQDTFTGRDLVKKSDTGWEAAQARAGYMVRQFMPNAPFVPGSYNFNKLADATAYAFDTEIGPYTGYTKSGDPVRMATVLPDVMTGTKIRSFDPQRGLAYQAGDLDKEEREIRANIRSAGKNKAMTEEARQRYIEGQQEKLRRLGERRAELNE